MAKSIEDLNREAEAARAADPEGCEAFLKQMTWLVSQFELAVVMADSSGVTVGVIVGAIGELLARVVARMPFPDEEARAAWLEQWMQTAQSRITVKVEQRRMAALAAAVEEAQRATKH